MRCRKTEASARREFWRLATATLPNGFGGGTFPASGLCETEVLQHGGAHGVCVCVCALLTEEVRRQLRRMSRERASLALKDQSHCNSPKHHQKGIRVCLQSLDHDVCVQHSAKAVSSQRKLGMASCPWTARDHLVSPEKASGGFSSSRTMHMCLRLVRS